MIALLIAGCRGAGGWVGPTNEPQPLEQACTSWTYGLQAGDQLGAAVAVLGDFDQDLVPEIAASKPSGGRLDQLLVLDGRGDGRPVAAEEALLNLVGPDDSAGVDAVVPTFAYGGGPLALGFGSGGVDEAGIVYAIPLQELLESDPDGEVTSDAFGPSWTGSDAGARLGAHVLVPPVLEGGPTLVMAARGTLAEVGGAVWLVYDWGSAATPPADVREVGVKVYPVYAPRTQSTAELVVPGADGAAVLLVSSGVAAGGESTVYGVVDPPQSGEQSLSDANFHIEGEPGDVFGDAMVNLADLDGDGEEDFAVRGSGAWYVSFGVPAGDAIDAGDLPLRLPFTAAEPSADLRCSGLTVGDYDGDDELDLAIGVCPTGSDGAAHVLLGPGWGPGVVDPVAEADLVLLGMGSGGASALASAPLDGGVDALVVGDWTWSSLGQAEQGSVFVCDLRDEFLP